VWWHTPVILVLRRLRQENFKFKASLGYKNPKSINNKSIKTNMKIIEV
jgi:hypothetical protein